MFSIFGKRKTSPVEEPDRPPIPSARADDGYVIVPSIPSGSVYPSIPGRDPFPTRQAPEIPTEPKVNISDTFNYMQGVPFTLCRDLQMASNQTTYAIEIGDLLAFASNKMNLNNYDYDFLLEKSVLKEI